MAKINTGGKAFIGGKINTGVGNIYPLDKVEVNQIRVYPTQTNPDHGKTFDFDFPKAEDVDMSDLPEGAILDPTFAGRYLHRGEKAYRLMRPVTMRAAQYVYVPA